MKVKLLKRLRRKGRGKITIYTITKTNGEPTGMKYGFNDDSYSGLFDLGDTEEDVLKKAERIYIESYLKENKERWSKKKKKNPFKSILNNNLKPNEHEPILRNKTQRKRRD